MESKKTKWYLWTALAVAVIIFLVIFTKDMSLNNEEGDINSQIGNIQESEGSVDGFSALTDTYIKKSATEPKSVYILDEKENKSAYVYTLKAEAGKFSPEELIIEKGKRVQIEFTAVDADYDISVAPPIGANITAKMGKTVVFGFDAETNKEGVYTFTCKELCPEGREMVGVMVIK